MAPFPYSSEFSPRKAKDGPRPREIRAQPCLANKDNSVVGFFFVFCFLFALVLAALVLAYLARMVYSLLIRSNSSWLQIADISKPIIY